ncbi:MAG: DUF4118 domain-containing protein [Solirubrobacteraceae bacterium]
MRARAQSILLRGPRPSAVSGFVATVILAGVCTGMVYPLKLVAPVSSLGVVYLLGVVVVSALWGLWLGIAMSVLSTTAFNFFHLPPLLRFTLADERNWVALDVLLAPAVATSSVGEVMRSRAFEAERRRAEADLTAEMAQLLLARVGVGDALALIGQRLAEVFELRWASIALGEVQGDRRRQAIALEVADGRAGTLVVPAGLSASVVARGDRERQRPADPLRSSRAARRSLCRAEGQQKLLGACWAPANPDCPLGRNAEGLEAARRGSRETPPFRPFRKSG